MPFGDRTGPAGAGPMTGRAAGFCAGFVKPGYANSVSRPGFMGRGRGGGRGWRNWYYATGLPGWARAAYGYPAWGGAVNPYTPFPTQSMAAEQELQDLKQQAELLRQQMENITKKIEGLEKKK